MLGVDLGGASAMTAAAAFWPDTGRLEAGGVVSVDCRALAERDLRDGVGAAYERMAERGELLTTREAAPFQLPT